MMSEAVIKLEHIQKSYGKSKILLDVNMEIGKGDIFGLIGRNGSGKTTIFKIILGLSEYNGGSVHVGEAGDSLQQGRGRTGFYVGQNFFPYMTARQNLEYYRILKKVDDKSEIERVLKLVGLEKAKSKVSAFSMGMKQRLGIANALLGNPEILILDEPVNGLDPQGIADIRNMLKRINSEFGTTIIISSHILSELQNTANKFGILDDGRIVKELSDEDLRIASNYVRLAVDDVPKAREVLEREGIRIYNQSSDKMSLEDYYFEQVGGGDD